MTTIILIKSVEQEQTVREVLGSVIEQDEPVYFLRLPSVRCLGPLIQEINPMIQYNVDYSIGCLTEGDNVSELVQFAVEKNANRICVGISERTLTGKARIDDLTESILLHEKISGNLIVGEHVIILEDLAYD